MTLHETVVGYEPGGPERILLRRTLCAKLARSMLVPEKDVLISFHGLDLYIAVAVPGDTDDTKFFELMARKAITAELRKVDPRIKVTGADLHWQADEPEWTVKAHAVLPKEAA